MNANQVARIAHEVSRVGSPLMVAWELASPAYRNACTNGAALVLQGRIGLDGFEAPVAAVFRACMPPVIDGNEESDEEPDRKPGFALKDISKRAPAYRESEKPGACEVKKFA